LSRGVRIATPRQIYLTSVRVPLIEFRPQKYPLRPNPDRLSCPRSPPTGKCRLPRRHGDTKEGCCCCRLHRSLHRQGRRAVLPPTRRRLVFLLETPNGRIRHLTPGEGAVATPVMSIPHEIVAVRHCINDCRAARATVRDQPASVKAGGKL
jgi:hypothetical protein